MSSSKSDKLLQHKEKELEEDTDTDESLTSDEEGDEANEKLQPVELGFCRKLDEYNSYRLLPHFFPVGKVHHRLVELPG